MEDSLWNRMNKRQKALYIIMASSLLPVALFLTSLHIRYLELYLLGFACMIIAGGSLYRKRKQATPKPLQDEGLRETP